MKDREQASWRTPPPRTAAEHERRALSLYSMGRYEEAIAEYGRTLELRPDAPELYSSRGYTYMLLGRLEEARRDLERAKTLAPDSIEVRHNRAGVSMRLGKFDEALADLDMVVTAHPDSAKARSDRAAVLLALHRYEEAVAEVTRALNSDPHDPQSQFILGCAYVRSGRPADALEPLRAAARGGMAPATEELDRALSLLFVEARVSGTAHAAAEAFLDSTTAKDLRDAVLRYPFMAHDAFVRSMRDAIPRAMGRNSADEVPGLQERLDLLRRLANE